MSDEQPFAAENPFRKLDKKSFQSAEDKKKKPAATLEAIRKAKKRAEAEIPADNEDAGTFLAAVSGATPLGLPAKPTFRKQTFTPPLENPVLDTLSHATKKLSSRESSVTAPVLQTEPAEFAPDYGGEVTPLSEKKSPRQRSREAVLRNKEAATSVVENEPDDGSAFFSAVRDVLPLSGKGREVPPEIPASVPIFVEESNPLQDFIDGKLEFALAFTEEYVECHVIGLDLITVGKLQAGQFSPEAHIDLHGMNAQQAFQALVGFFRGAYLKGLRTLLVVPGRGLNSPHGMSILREKLQDWFTQEPFRRVILAFCTAKPVDGGAGALYVLMRKYRKDRGKVFWDRRPVDPDLLQ